MKMPSIDHFSTSRFQLVEQDLHPRVADLADCHKWPSAGQNRWFWPSLQEFPRLIVSFCGPIGGKTVKEIATTALTRTYTSAQTCPHTRGCSPDPRKSYPASPGLWCTTSILQTRFWQFIAKAPQPQNDPLRAVRRLQARAHPVPFIIWGGGL